MPTPFWAALASLLGLVLWLLTRRQPRTLLRSTDTAAVAALNRAQIELVSRVETVETPSNPPEASSSQGGAASGPSTARAGSGPSVRTLSRLDLLTAL